jgi:hypothetical protein
MREARLGAQTVVPQYACRNLVPSAAIRSIAGVRISF